MTKDIILIDFENVQSSDLSALYDSNAHVKFFLGANQQKISVALAKQIQRLGDRAEYIEIAASGRNALDFCIAWYLGVLSVKESKTRFHVVSKDTGFDALITHLRAQKISVGRCTTLNDVPCEKPVPAGPKAPTRPFHAKKAPVDNSKQLGADAKRALEHLKKHAANRPKKLESLHSALMALFAQKRTRAQINAIVNQLNANGNIVVSGASIAYKL